MIDFLRSFIKSPEDLILMAIGLLWLIGVCAVGLMVAVDHMHMPHPVRVDRKGRRIL